MSQTYAFGRRQPATYSTAAAVVHAPAEKVFVPEGVLAPAAEDPELTAWKAEWKRKAWRRWMPKALMLAGLAASLMAHPIVAGIVLWAIRGALAAVLAYLWNKDRAEAAGHR